MRREADRFVGALLRGRRPGAFAATADDAAEIRTAIELIGARPHGGAPREEFTDALRRRIAARNAPPGTRPRGRGGAAAGRRRLLQAGGVAASAFAAGFAVDRCFGPRAAAGSDGSDEDGTGSGEGAANDAPSPGCWSTVARSADLPEGSVRPFDLGSAAGFVQRTGGRLRAVSGICTHQGCRLRLDPARTTLVCPCHGAAFALTGSPLTPAQPTRRLPALPALPRIPVRETDGRIEVYGPAPRQPTA